MKIQEIINNLDDDKIVCKNMRVHTKASEQYIDVKFIQDDGFQFETSIPYFYRRTGLFYETENQVSKYLKEIRSNFTKFKIKKFITEESERWKTEYQNKKTTKEFFDKLLNLKWNSVEKDLPDNPNWARRIQDIKEFGYTLSTHTSMQIGSSGRKGTHILLVPLKKGGVTGYEIMSEKFKSRVIRALNGINIYEMSRANPKSLIPDHKFPEIRWDEKVKENNPENMDSRKIHRKFQLLDNQRNQQKREVCRKCFQTGLRGSLFKIEYFYSGNKEWPKNVPKTGKEAERGCFGCGWYDIKAWRESISRKLND